MAAFWEICYRPVLAGAVFGVSTALREASSVQNVDFTVFIYTTSYNARVNSERAGQVDPQAFITRPA
jgi:hypothetical protein